MIIERQDSPTGKPLHRRILKSLSHPATSISYSLMENSAETRNEDGKTTLVWECNRLGKGMVPV